MKTTLRIGLAAAALAFSAQAAAQITFYEREGFEGRTFETTRQVGNFERFGFNDRASSAVVTSGRWEVCEDRRFEGNCVVLRRGQYPSLRAMGLNNSISSVRPIARERRAEQLQFAPPPPVAYDYRRRGGERLYEAEVTSVRAVVGPPEQRCWVDRERVGGRGDANVGGAIAGAVIGGILGHQVGSGRGNDVATALGAVAGGAVGSNVGRDEGPTGYVQNVRRCETVPSSAAPAYWDVTYRFRGKEYRVQTTSPPDRTIMVNAQGEPRAGT